jgi:L-threonylcarbamoyladenylate synthase
VEKLFRMKGRPRDKPLPVIAGDRHAVMSVVKSVPRHAEGLMERYWPGPLTLVFEARDTVSELLTGATGKVAVRIPGEGIALDMVRYVKLPLTATSANISGLPPAVDASSLRGYFDENIDMIIDSGKAPGGSPSTIIDVTVSPHRILRQGRIIVEEGDGS